MCVSSIGLEPSTITATHCPPGIPQPRSRVWQIRWAPARRSSQCDSAKPIQNGSTRGGLCTATRIATPALRTSRCGKRPAASDPGQRNELSRLDSRSGGHRHRSDQCARAWAWTGRAAVSSHRSRQVTTSAADILASGTSGDVSARRPQIVCTVVVCDACSMTRASILWLIGGALATGVFAAIALVRRRRSDDLGSVSAAWTSEHTLSERGGDR
jgi:hypothetical protein